jgi:hypothetical protein
MCESLGRQPLPKRRHRLRALPDRRELVTSGPHLSACPWRPVRQTSGGPTAPHLYAGLRKVRGPQRPVAGG